jgi:hypothetical protein
VLQIAGKTGRATQRLQAEAVVTESADHQFALRLKIRAGRLVGTRDIKGRSCNDLVGALAVALALLLSPEEPLDEHALGDSSSGASGSPPGEAEAPPPPTPPPPTPPPPSPPPPPDDDGSADGPARRWHVLLTPLVAVGLGPQRHALRGLGGAAGFSFDDWRVLAEGKLWASRDATPWSQDESGATLDQFTLSLRGCRRLWGRRFELSPCVLLSVQHLSARGLGRHIAAQTSSATWLAPGVGLRARFLLTPWLGLVAAADGDVQLSQPEVTLEGVGSVERLYPVAATASIGAEWIL